MTQRFPLMSTICPFWSLILGQKTPGRWLITTSVKVSPVRRNSKTPLAMLHVPAIVRLAGAESARCPGETSLGTDPDEGFPRDIDAPVAPAAQTADVATATTAIATPTRRGATRKALTLLFGKFSQGMSRNQ